MPDNKSLVSVPTGTSVRDDHHISEQALERLAKDIEKKLAEGAHKSESKSSPACIYKVPEQLRKQKESAYTPHFISIGPIHSNNEQIKNSNVQGVKLSYANSLFGRKILPKEGKSEEDGKKSTALEECVQKMSELLESAKKCYAQEVEELNAEMLVIDGCFILELLYKFCHTEFNIRNDPIFDIHLMPIYLRNGLLLLENQLPFFVLQALFGLTVARINPAKPGISLTDYVVHFFDDMLNSEARGRRARKKRGNREENHHHILHILQNLGYFRSDDAGGENQTGLSKFMPCASDLEYAGVKFVVDSKVSFSDARGPSRLFGRVYFEIPSLCIYDTIEPVLRNLIAFEQCNCPGVTRFFTSYAFLMETLINTPNDVQVLENAGIIRNYLGTSDDVTKPSETSSMKLFSGSPVSKNQ